MKQIIKKIRGKKSQNKKESMYNDLKDKGAIISKTGGVHLPPYAFKKMVREYFKENKVWLDQARDYIRSK